MNFSFHPVRLERVLREVRRRHPRLGRPSAQEIETLLDRLRILLKDTPWSRLKQLAETLTSREVSGCFRILVSEREGNVPQKAAVIVQLRPRTRFMVEGWTLLTRVYPHPLLEAVVKGLVGVLGPEPLRQALRERAWTLDWLGWETLVEGCVTYYESEEEREALDVYLARAGLEPNDGLYREAWRRLLTQGSRESLLAHRAMRLIEQIQSCAIGDSDRQAFGRRYLSVLDRPADWDPVVLEWILERFGEPAPSGRSRPEHPFWAPLPQEVKDRYRRWLLARQVDAFFEGERAEFWREYVHRGWVRDVRVILDGEGFMLDFDRFGVVEFKRIGNAAYIYPKPVFQEFWRRADQMGSPNLFKDRSRTLGGPWGHRGSDGRIIHHENWQTWARELIDYHLGGPEP